MDPAVVTEMVLAIASGDLDAWSGRMVRVGVDTPAGLAERAAAGLGDQARTVSPMPYGEDDPLA